MPNELVSLLFGALGALIVAAIQYRFQRLTAEYQERREIIETHFLQLQDSLESLAYRIVNIREKGGKQVMTDDYFRNTSVYAIGRVLAYESLLVSKGIYAKLHRNADTALKRQLKSELHRINWGLNDQHFFHYYRLQLAETLLKDGRILSYTEFLSRATDPACQPVIAAASAFVGSAEPKKLDEIRSAAEHAIRLLEKQTKVPSAFSLG